MEVASLSALRTDRLYPFTPIKYRKWLKIRHQFNFSFNLDVFFEFMCFEATNVPTPGAASRYHKTAHLFEDVMKSENSCITAGLHIRKRGYMQDRRHDSCLIHVNALHTSTIEGKANPITGLDRPWGFQEVEAPRFQDSRHMQMVRSALGTGRLYPPGNIPGTHFC